MPSNQWGVYYPGTNGGTVASVNNSQDVKTVPASPSGDHAGMTNTQFYLASVLVVSGPQQGAPLISDPSEVILQGQDAAGTSFVRSS
jgi:hypothetical protein